MQGREAWDAVATAHPYGTFWHTDAWCREYAAAFRPGSQWHGALLRVTVSDATESVGVAPLMYEPWAGAGQFTVGGDPTPAPLYRTIGEGAVLWEQMLEVIRRRGRPASFRDRRPIAVYMTQAEAEGWTIDPWEWATRVIPLRGQSEADLWSGVRRSYRSLIHAGVRNWTVHLGGGLDTPATEAVWAGYCQMHQATVGQALPRGPETYALQRRWMREGRALLLGLAARDAEETWLGFAYLIAHHGRAWYYASGPSIEPNAQHVLQWEALKGLQRIGAEEYEIGWQGYDSTEKGRAIDFFKRGFGGRDRPMYGVRVVPPPRGPEGNGHP